MKLRQAMQKRDGSGWKLSKIPVIEIFGPTIQGEGMVVGQKTMFVRTAGCDYSCSWCDSSFTWDGSGKHLIVQMTAEEIWSELKRLGVMVFICHDFRRQSCTQSAFSRAHCHFKRK